MTHKGGRLLSTLVCFLFSYLTLTIYRKLLGAPMCYDNSIIHIGALFQKGVCDLAEKRKDRNGRVLKTGENQRKNGTYEWPMLLRWGSQPC